jgi:hypothetical protein
MSGWPRSRLWSASRNQATARHPQRQTQRQTQDQSTSESRAAVVSSPVNMHRSHPQAARIILSRERMGHPRHAYLFGVNQSTSSRGVWNKSVSLETVRCSLYPGHQRPGRRLGTLSVEFAKSDLNKDFLWTWLSDCLIKDVSAHKLASVGLTGFSTRPAEVTSEGRSLRTKYDEFVTTGWGGIARPESGVELTETCPVCGMLEYSGVRNWRSLIDGKQWDGSDFFMVWPLPRFIFMTSRAAETLKRMQVSGISIQSLNDLEPQEDGLSPGRMSYWYSAETLDRHKISPDLR